MTARDVDPEVLLKTKDVCQLLGGVCRQTIERWLIEGPGFPRPFQFRPSGPRFWRRAEVLEWRERYRCPAVEKAA